MVILPPAAAQRYSFKQYGQDEGLNNLDVYCMMQDRAGFLWVATEGGLYRYDGHAFRAYTTAQGLPSAQVTALHQTADGVIWAGTSEGLARLAGDLFEKVPAEMSGVGSILSDSRGNLYVGSAAGLWVASPGPDQREFRLYVHARKGGPRVGGMALDASERLWFGCGNGICTFEKGQVSETSASGVPNGCWQGLLFDRHGNLWARSMENLVELPSGATRFQRRDVGLPMGGRSPSVFMDHEGRIFVPTCQGLAHRTSNGWQIIRRANGLPVSAVDYFLQDREGSVWIALDGRGLVRWLGYPSWETWTESEGLTHDVVWAVTRDEYGTLWAATQAGISCLSRGASRWTSLPHPLLNMRRNLDIVRDPDGSLWIAQAPGGVVHFDPRTGQAERYGAPALGTEWVHALVLDAKGRIVAGTNIGVFVGKRAGRRFQFTPVEVPFGTPPVYSMIEDTRGRLWAATARGLCYIENGRARVLTVQDGLRHDAVSYVAEAPDRSIWLAYRDPIGVTRLTFDGARLKARHYDATDGVPSAKPYFLKFDRRGWLWLGTDMGVQRFDGRSWAHYDKADGLALSDCDHNAFFDDDDGTVWIGTPRGLSHLLNPSIPARQWSAPVVLTRIQLGAAQAPLQGPIQVPFARRSLDADFAALTFVNEDSVRFRHRVLGLDESWNETQQPEAHYPGLPPGRYRFQVQAAVEGGAWSGPAAEVAFTIEPPWWRRWWSLSAAPLLFFLAVGQLWRCRERSMLKRQQELERAVADRTGKLALEHRRAIGEKALAEREKAVVEKQKVEIERLLRESRQAERVKSEFVANMSHEVRTPLNGIMGLTDIVLNSGVTPEQSECLLMVKSSSDSLLSLINGVLDFSKLEAGKVQLDSAEFDLRSLIADTVKSLEGLARPKHLELRTRVDATVPAIIVGDPGRLRQVLVNLAGNAIKFTGTGFVEVAAGLHQDPEARPLLHIRVRDTGIGIPPGQQSLIFEPFRQADGSTSRRYGGTGLGLSIAAQLVSLMGGKIWLESAPGSGSTFHFTVRFEQPGKGAPRAVASYQSEVEISGLRILLVEDNPINQKVALRILETSGNHVTCAGDGREALAACDTQTFDLILMDVQMPLMDGFEAAAELRKRETPLSRRTPILALTANAMKGDRERCLSAGMDGYVAKPFKKAELFEAISVVLRTHCAGMS